MTREEVYDKCTEKIAHEPLCNYKVTEVARMLLPREAIDAIIDCAVEEAVLALKGGKQG